MFWKNIRLTNRIFFFYAALIIASTAAFGAFAYMENVRTAEDNFTNVISGNLELTGNKLQNLFGTIENQANLLAYGATAQDVLTKPGGESAARQYDDYVAMNKAIDAFEKTEGLSRIRLVLEQPRKFMNDGIRYFTRDGNDPAVQGRLLVRRNNHMSWVISGLQHPPDTAAEPIFSCVADVVSIRDIGERLATVYFDVSEAAVSQMLTATNVSPVGNVYLLDSQGAAISTLNGAGLGTNVLPEKTWKQVEEGGQGSLNLARDGRPGLLVYRTLRGYPYTLAAEIPMQAIRDRSKTIFQSFLWIGLVIVSLSFLVAYLISAGVTRRIKRLAQAMGTIEKNNFQVQVPSDYGDEVGILSRKFNWMVEHIRTLIENVYRTGLAKKEAELSLLHAQINPHFLYNTLDSINWLALKYRANEISYMVRNLSDFFRHSLNAGRLTTLESEIRHLQAYFNIQKYRFENRIHLQLEVPPELYAYETLSLVLQPLAENAILHGILKQEGREGVITVRGEEADGCLMLEVRDNGLGIEPARLRQIEEQLRNPHPAASGNGLRNVHQRIRIHYGEEYGLNIISEPGVGTSCILIFPAVK